VSNVQVNPDGSGFAKSSFSSGGGSCVELHRDGDAIRDSKNTAGSVLRFDGDARDALVRFTRNDTTG